MIESDVLKRVILEVLEVKVEALKKNDTLLDQTMIRLYLWDDLIQNYSALKSITEKDVISALSGIEDMTDGLFKPTLMTQREKRSDLMAEVSYGGEHVTPLYWQIKYSKKAKPEKSNLESNQFFWLGDRTLETSISNVNCSISFSPRSVQSELLRYFSENKGFIETNELASAVGRNLGNDTSEGTVRTEIGDLNRKAKEHFGLDEKEFIEGIPRMGYCFKHKIKPKKV